MADLSLICTECSGLNSIPIEEGVSEYTCEHCGQVIPIQDSLDAFTSDLKDPLIGETVSECEIMEKVGEGGFGAVYRAFDKNLQRPVALKVMLQSLTSNMEFVQKFIREAVTAAALNHPNIVSIHKVGRDEERGLHFLIMEFLEGRTLSEIIEERGALPMEEAISIVLQCADALAVAQDKKIIHRDIKPENIMIDQHGVVKITDFGLAKTMSSDMKSTKVVGTPHYMSPEQFEGKDVDGRTDIYSLGITFYYMLTKAKPYQGTNTVQIIYSILTQDPRSVLEFNDDLPDEVWRIIKKMIAKDVEERYQNFRDVRQDLIAFQESSLAQKVTCSGCGVVNVTGRKFCRECGASLMIRCIQCGHEEAAGVRHCGECGADIESLQKVKNNLDRGAKLRGVGDLKQAMAFYQEVLRLDPEHQEAREASKDIQAALEQIEKRKAEVDRLVEEGEPEAALEKVESLLAEFPGDDVKTYGKTVRASLQLRAIEAHLMVAEKALDEGRLENALDAYRSALEVDPERDDIRRKLEDLEARVAALSETLAAAEKAYAEGRHVDALNSAKEVLRLKPGHVRAAEIIEEAKGKVTSIEAIEDEARKLIAAGNYDEAISRLDTAMEISPGDETVASMLQAAKKARAALEEKLSLVRRLLAEGKPEEALRGIEEVLADRPENPSALNLKEQAEQDLGEIRKKEEVGGLVKEGMLAEEAGNLEGALVFYVQALEQEPDNQDAAERREKVEARIQEVEGLERVLDEHLSACAFKEALEAIDRLLALKPKDEALLAKKSDATKKQEDLTAALARASEAGKRKRFDLAKKAAEEALAISPSDKAAQNAMKEAERGLAAVAKHLSEAKQLIESELFDDALIEVNKAEEMGARPEEVKELREAAEEGKKVLLKSDATRSFVFKDYASAVEKYEKILEVDGGDSDAKKGKRLAERLLRAQQREGVLSKVFLVGAVLVVLLLMMRSAPGPTAGPVARPSMLVALSDEYLKKFIDAAPADEVTAMREGRAEDVSKETLALFEKMKEMQSEKPPEAPSVETVLGWEKSGDWQQLEKNCKEQIAAFNAYFERRGEEVPEAARILREGVAYAEAMAAAGEVDRNSFAHRVEAYEDAKASVGNLPALANHRYKVISDEIGKVVREWVERPRKMIERGEDWSRVSEVIGDILDNDAVQNDDEARPVVERIREFTKFMAEGEQSRKSGAYEEAVWHYKEADALRPEEDLGKYVETALGKVREDWVASLRDLLSGGEQLSEQELYDKVIEKMAHMAELLGIVDDSDIEELFDEVTRGTEYGK